MNSSNRLLFIVRVFVLGIFLTAPARALVLISEARSVYASYYNNGIETHHSDGNFGLFDATAIGIPYGGGNVWVHQLSDITTSGFKVQHWAYDFYGYGAVGTSYFQLRFALTEPTAFVVSAFTWSYPGLARLEEDTRGVIPVQWPYGSGGRVNSMDLTLGAGIYTFTSSQNYGDSMSLMHEFRVKDSVPDGGSTVALLGLALLSLVAVHRKLA